MYGIEHFMRLAACLVVAAGLGAAIKWPDAGRQYTEKVAQLRIEPAPLAGRACVRGESPLTGPFAPFDDILSVSPLGGVTAPGEPLPAPYVRLNTLQGATAFERRTTTALAPARADIVAIERHVARDAAGAPTGLTWSVHFAACETVRFSYDDLDEISPDLLAKAGGLKAFVEIGGPDHLALTTQLRVRAGEVIGKADGFDIALENAAVPAAALDRPERYRPNTYNHATAINAPQAVIDAISPDVSRAQCPLDYLPEKIAGAWKAKLGDAFGFRKARGDNACRTALADIPGTAQGAWFTDASHNGLTRKVSAVALAPDVIDPARLVFALHGRLASLGADMVGLSPFLEEERAEAARDFLTFEARTGRINAPFDKVRPGETYCYESLRVNFVGPRINGVILLALSEETGAPLMKIEARGDTMSCIDLAEPWSFTGAETTFYR